MLRRTRILRTRVHQVMDSGLVMLSLWIAHFLRDHYKLGREAIASFDEFMWLWVVIVPTAALALNWQGFYERPVLFSKRQTAWMLLKTSAVVTVAIIISMFFVREQLARGVIVLFSFTSFILLFGKEMVLEGYNRTRAARAQLQRRVILVGGGNDLEALRQRLRTHAPGSLEIVAELPLEAGAENRLIQLLHQHSAEGVIVNARHSFFGEAERILQVCELEGVEAWLVADFFKTNISRTTLDDFYGIPIVVFRSAPEASWQGLMKQMMDYAGAFLGLVIISPFLIVLALLIRFGSRGPVLFRQQRCGLHGKPFIMLKFRTMVSDAEQRKHELEALNEMSGPVFKVTNDPRVTRIGRWLRKYSLDELPQLFNVLKGDMSLVGPRPLPVDEVQRFDDLSHRRRLSVKPGLTCLWQISGRNELRDFKEWVRLDLEYIDHWSLWLDLKILARTIPVVITGSGAK